jgi:hypothetical protein
MGVMHDLFNTVTYDVNLFSVCSDFRITLNTQLISRKIPLIFI